MRIKYSKDILFFFILYASLVYGFFWNENLNFGSYYDWMAAYVPVIKDFSINFKQTILSYEKYGQRHSPVYLIFLSFFLKLGLSLEFVRIVHLHLCLSLIFIFYKCLKINFQDIDKKYLKLLSFVIFLSPSFRSLAIWPDSRLPGLIFFVLSIYFFLKFRKNNNANYAWRCSLALIVSSYISPNFSLFSLYFYFYFLKKIEIKQFLLLIIFNIFASIPVLYYLFYLKINFLISGRTPGIDSSVAFSFNFSDKILIISSIFLFHLLPILIVLKKFYKNYFNYLKKNYLLIFMFLLFLIYFFNYKIYFTGGGIFFQLSQILLGYNFFFFVISLFAITLIFYLSKYSANNFFLIVLLIISNIQNSIYHKYYEPMILVIFFTLFKYYDLKFFFNNKNNIVILYIFSFGHIFLRIIKNTFF